MLESTTPTEIDISANHMRIALIGEYDPSFEPHILTAAAIGHAARKLDLHVEFDWVSTADVSERLFESFQAVWIAPGSPYKDMGKTLWAIQHARENGIPCFGTCGGFQHMVIEYARNQLGIQDAEHAEYDPYASNVIVSRLSCSLVGRDMELRFVAGSRVAEIYGVPTATESYYCNFGVNADFVPQFADGDFRIVGSDTEGEARVMEIYEHPFYIGTLYVPQSRSHEGNPHPLVTGFLLAAYNRLR